jgi:hypothetical protein
MMKEMKEKNEGIKMVGGFVAHEAIMVKMTPFEDSSSMHLPNLHTQQT